MISHRPLKWTAFFCQCVARKLGSGDKPHWILFGYQASNNFAWSVWSSCFLWPVLFSCIACSYNAPFDKLSVSERWALFPDLNHLLVYISKTGGFGACPQWHWICFGLLCFSYPLSDDPRLNPSKAELGDHEQQVSTETQNMIHSMDWCCLY